MVAASSRVGRAGVLAVIFSLVMLCGCAANGTSSQGQPAQGAGASQGQVQRGTVDFKPNNIPVLYLNIDESAGATVAEMNASEDHSVECRGTADLVVPEGFDAGYGAVQGSLRGLELEYVRGRGHTTWRHVKKPYKIKFSEKQDLFGMGANKHWVLLANYFDGSLVRNRLTNWLARRLGVEFVMGDVPVDLVMNGTYLGSYVLCEHLRVGEGRVDIGELKAGDADPETITGGYLMALDPYPDDPPESTFETRRGVRLLNDTPSFDPDGGGSDDYANDAQRDYVRAYVQRAEDAIFGEGDAPYQDLVDARSFADCWLMQEFTMNRDMGSNIGGYLYKKRGGKLCWGPLWDFDRAYNVNSCAEEPVDFFLNVEMPWFDRLRGDPEFRRLLEERWAVLDGLVASATAEGGLLDQYKGEMRQSWQADFAMYGPVVRMPPASKLDDYDAEIEALRSWLDRRRAWVSAHIGQVNRITQTITFRADGQDVATMTVRVGDEPEDLPEAPEKAGYRFVGWYVGNQEVFSEDEVERVEEVDLLGDLVVEARYVEQ